MLVSGGVNVPYDLGLRWAGWLKNAPPFGPPQRFDGPKSRSKGWWFDIDWRVASASRPKWPPNKKSKSHRIIQDPCMVTWFIYLRFQKYTSTVNIPTIFYLNVTVKYTMQFHGILWECRHLLKWTRCFWGSKIPNLQVRGGPGCLRIV